MITDVNWTNLSGKVLEGGYEIQELLAADQTGRIYKVRVLGDPSAHVVLKIFPDEDASADEQIELWNSSRVLQHPNLSVPQAAGRMQVDGVNVAFVIMPRPDEVLEGILLERPLGSDEAKEVLLSAAQALDYLHGHGFIHGSISPAQVLAVGEFIQLSAENVRKVGSGQGRGSIRTKYVAPEAQAANVTPEADVWCLGATLFEALTQQVYRERGSEIAAKLPSALAGVARRCLDPDPQARCTAGEIPALYRSGGPVGHQAEDPPPQPKSAVLVIPPIKSIRESIKPTPNLQPRSRMPWILGVVAFLIIFILIWSIRASRSRGAPPARLPQTPATGSPALSSATVQPSAAAPAKNTPTKSSITNSLSPSAPLHRTAPRGEDVKTVNGPIWRVVLYTYSREKDAQNMAHILNQKHRGLDAGVFTPDRKGTSYLVVAGGRMTHDEAARLRRKVERMGLPRDSYVQNYAQ